MQGRVVAMAVNSGVKRSTSRWLRAAQKVSGPLTEPPPMDQAEGVLSVKSVLSDRGEAISEDRPWHDPDLIHAWEERAAIREYDGGQSREDADRDAAREVGAELVAVRPDVDRTMDTEAFVKSGEL